MDLITRTDPGISALSLHSHWLPNLENIGAADTVNNLGVVQGGLQNVAYCTTIGFFLDFIDLHNKIPLKGDNKSLDAYKYYQKI